MREGAAQIYGHRHISRKCDNFRAYGQRKVHKYSAP